MVESFLLPRIRKPAGRRRAGCAFAGPRPEALDHALPAGRPQPGTRQAEDARHGPGGWHQAVLAAVQQGIIVYDWEGRIQTWNPFMEGLTGYREADVQGQRLGTFLPSLEPAGSAEARNHALLGEVVKSAPFAWSLPRNGRSGWATVTHAPLRAPAGSILGVVATLTDVTEQMRREERLRDAGKALEETFENTLVGFYRTTPAGQVLLTNPALRRILGLSSLEEIQGLDLERQYPVQDYTRAQYRTRLEREGRIEGMEACWRLGDGRLVYVRENAWTVRGADGTVLYYEGTIEDVTERRRAEEEIQRLNRDLEQRVDSRTEALRVRTVAIDAAANTIAVTDAAGLLEWVNPAFQQLTGYSSDEVLGRPVDILRSGVHPPAFYTAKWATVQGGQVWRGDVVTRLKDGSLCTTAQTITPVKGRSGSIEHYIFIKEDVTERRLAEERLRKMSLAVEQAATAIVITDLDGTIEYVNPCFTRISGYTAEEAIGTNPRILKSGLTPDPVYQDLWATLRAGRVWHGELCNRTKAGASYWESLTISPITDGRGRNTHFLAVAQDVTEQRHMQEMRLRISTALDQAQEAIAIVDLELRLIYANATFRRSFEGVREANLAMAGLTPEAPSLAQILAQVQQGQAWSGRLPLKTNDGQDILAEGSISPVLDGGGRTESLAVVLRDVTRDVEQDQHLRQTEKMNALGTLAGGVAHDFNNILGAIFAAVELIEWKLEPESPIRKTLDIIYQVAIRARDLNEQILRFSRASEDRRIPFDLSGLALEASNLLRVTLGEQVQVQTQLAAHLRILGDPSQLHQVLLNLAINAGHAMRPRGGTLSITLRPVALAEGASEQLLPGPYALLTVEDTGCGMDAATVAKIFEPFYTTKGPGEGTGLGLSVVHGIIHSHGGAIQVTSQPGKGSCFQIHLPLLSQGAEAADTEAVKDCHGSERILFVDDADIIAALAKQGLQSLGYHVTAKTSAVDALDVFQADPLAFDLLVTAQTMPRMSGAELTRRLRSLRPDLPVILVAAAAPGFDRTPYLGMSYDEAMAKPYTTTDLATAIRQVLARRAPQAEGPGARGLQRQPQDAADRRPTILLVEDSRSTRRILERQLTQGGFRVKAAKDGQEAWECFHAAADQWPFAMVLTDLIMPRMDGLELIRKIRRHDPELPIVILSSDNDGDTAKAALQLQVNEFLHKPIEPRLLTACVARHLAKRAHREETEQLVATAMHVRSASQAMEAIPVEGLPVFSICEQLSDAGGDVFRCLQRPDGSLMLILADVAGHSVLSSYAVASFLGMLTTSLQEEPELESLFTALNQSIQSGPFPDIPIATLAAHWDPRTGRLQVLNAGIPHGIWLRKGLDQTDPIPLNGAPLGLFDRPRMNGKVLVLEAGDRVLFGSDGLLDGFSEHQVPFRDLAPDLWRQSAGLPIDQALQAMCEHARSHTGVLQDDLLAVGFEQPPWQPLPSDLIRVLPSTLDAVEQCCQEVADFLAARPEARDLEPAERFNLLLCLREVLSNAERHGNQENPHKRIAVHIDLATDPARFRVVDEGRGFHLEGAKPAPDGDLEGGRGLTLLEAFTLGPQVRDGEFEFAFPLRGRGHE
jgi:PAS domain S-box-containing protein